MKKKQILTSFKLDVYLGLTEIVNIGSTTFFKTKILQIKTDIII